MFRDGNLLNYLSSIFVALGHIGLVMTLVDRGGVRRPDGAIRACQPDGIYQLTDAPAGPDHRARWSRAPQTLFVIHFRPWFRRSRSERYRFGAMEWIWAVALTNWGPQPFGNAWPRPAGSPPCDFAQLVCRYITAGYMW